MSKFLKSLVLSLGSHYHVCKQIGHQLILHLDASGVQVKIQYAQPKYHMI